MDPLMTYKTRQRQDFHTDGSETPSTGGCAPFTSAGISAAPSAIPRSRASPPRRWSSSPDQKRHLLRLWLTAHDFSSVEELLRCGIPKQ